MIEAQSQPQRNIIVIGSSAGGVEALLKLISTLPTDFQATIFIVMHMLASGPSLLSNILNRSSSLPVRQALDKAPIEAGHIYVAAPDHHLLLEADRMRVIYGPKENRSRPAIDPLFRSAALHHTSRVIGVVLTGNLDDGTAGLQMIKVQGGLAVVQSPAEALFDSMPLSAIKHVDVDYVVPIAEMSELLVRLTRVELVVEAIPTASSIIMDVVRADSSAAIFSPYNQVNMKLEVENVMMENTNLEEVGRPSGFACPDCGGVLREIQEGKVVRFRCRVGHALSLQTLQAAQHETLETALWSALEALEEKTSLARRMVAYNTEHQHLKLSQHYEEEIEKTKRQVSLIKETLGMLG